MVGHDGMVLMEVAVVDMRGGEEEGVGVEWSVRGRLGVAAVEVVRRAKVRIIAMCVCFEGNRTNVRFALCDDKIWKQDDDPILAHSSLSLF